MDCRGFNPVSAILNGEFGSNKQTFLTKARKI